MINALRTLASAAFDALAEFTSPVADAIWDEARRRRPLAELTLLEEIADHAGTIRAQLEDIRNLLQQQNSLALGLPPVCNCNTPVPGFHVWDCPADRSPKHPAK